MDSRSTPIPHPRVRGAWRLAMAATAVLSAPPAAALQVRIDSAYTGSTSLESAGTSIPVPDVAGAVGSDHFVELLNGRYAVYDKRTGALVESSSQVDFWTQAGVPGPIDQAADPRLLYDPTNGRWYAVAISLAPESTSDDLLTFAVSRGPDPTQDWVGFPIDADPARVNWLDFSMLGMNVEGVYAAVSRMAPGTGSFLGTAVVTLPKADLLSATPSIAGATVLVTSVAQTGFDPQPAVDLDGSALPLPLLSGNGAFLGQLQAARIQGPLASPSLVGGILVPVEAAPGPPDARQPGDKLPLETGGRTNVSLFSGNVLVRNGSLWAVQGIDLDGRAAIRWLEVDPELDIVLQSGVVADDALDLYTASIAVNELDQVVIGFTGSSDTVFPSAYAVVGERVGGSTVFGDLLLLRAGVSDYERLDARGRNAWGTYSTTVVDPSDPSAFWTFQEFVIDTDVWGVAITKLVVPEPASGVLTMLGGLLGLGIARSRRRRRGRIALLGLGIALSAASVQGATFVVDSTADTADANPGDGICADGLGRCTLRAALRESNGNGGADEISLPQGSFPLPAPVLFPWSGENPLLLEDLTISGAGADLTTVEGSLVVGWCIFGCSGPNVRIRRLTILGPTDGIGIESYGTLEIDSAAVRGPWGVLQEGGALVIERSAIHGSVGVYGKMVDRGCAHAVLEFGNSTAHGIGLWCGVATIRSSTVASSQGAALSAWGEFVESSWVDLRSSIIAADAPGPACDVQGHSEVTSLGHNIDTDGTCGLGRPTDRSNVDPLLGPLQDNGGPTQTHPLQFGSPAIDAIPAADCAYDDDGDPGTPDVPLATDQRGVGRPQEGDGASPSGCDIGAYETTRGANGIDDDGDGKIDFDGGATAGLSPSEQTAPDAQCGSATCVREQWSCGLGAEVALLGWLAGMLHRARRAAAGRGATQA